MATEDINNIPRSPSQLKSAVIQSTARFLSAGLSSISAASFLALAITGKPQPVLAATSVEAANAKLSTYDLPPVLFVPPSFSVVVSEYGRGNYRAGLADKKSTPVLVQFAYPQMWVVATTTVNNNGEAGTISANDYIKGDSAFYFASELDAGESLRVDSKALIKKHLIKSLSQKGDPTESLNLGDISEGQPGPNGQKYVIVNFSYELNTEAGFLIARRGTMSLAQIGNTVHSVVAVTTQKRFKQIGDAIRDVAKSFRVYKLNTGVFSSNS